MARRVYLINKGFQLRFLLFLFIIAVVVTATYLTASFQFFTRFEQLTADAGFPVSQPFLEFLADQKRTLLLLFFLSSVFSAAFIGTFGLLFSHRLAGPLYRLHQHMLRVASGDPDTPETLKFREGDFFNELADAYNAQYKKLKG